MKAVGKLDEMGVVDLQLVKDINGLRKLFAQIIGRVAHDLPSTPRIRNRSDQQCHCEQQAHNDRPDNV
jgi:hypothetical protein